MRQPVQVAVYCARKRGDGWEYLLLHRVADRGRFWQGVTGGVIDDEDCRTAALRELSEETGFHPAGIKRIDYSYTFPVDDRYRSLYDQPVNKITEYVYVAVIEGSAPPKIDPAEHDDWRWCPFDEAMELLRWSGNKEALRRCRDFIEKK